MTDIFISYKREEQATARLLANALERRGWTVWWDPRLRVGERFDDVIEAALEEAKCVIVMWSRRSVKSTYVKDEATYALKRNKLAPVAIEDVVLPLRFEGLHTPSLVDWDGSEDAPAFQGLVEDIAAILGYRPKQREHEPKPEPLQYAKELAAPGPVFRDKLRDGSPGPEMVVIPPGEFRMGDIQGTGGAYEQPVHSVRIPRPFAMGRYEVTFDEYDVFARLTNRHLPADKGWGRKLRPVINVSWEDARAYAQWLSQQTGKRYQLLTEAEWEYAARAGSETSYWWGDKMEKNRANCNPWLIKVIPRIGKTEPVGSFQPNPWGLYDTAGNVWEWVQDCWHKNYEGAPENGSKAWEEGGGDCNLRVVRGGSWVSKPWLVRSASRDGGGPDFRDSNLGFRLAQDLD